MTAMKINLRDWKIHNISSDRTDCIGGFAVIKSFDFAAHVCQSTISMWCSILGLNDMSLSLKVSRSDCYVQVMIYRTDQQYLNIIGAWLNVLKVLRYCKTDNNTYSNSKGLFYQ